jgi:hypothetical protein
LARWPGQGFAGDNAGLAQKSGGRAVESHAHTAKQGPRDDRPKTAAHCLGPPKPLRACLSSGGWGQWAPFIRELIPNLGEIQAFNRDGASTCWAIHEAPAEGSYCVTKGRGSSVHPSAWHLHAPCNRLRLTPQHVTHLTQMPGHRVQNSLRLRQHDSALHHLRPGARLVRRGRPCRACGQQRALR